MRSITEIIIHCSATAEGKDYTVADISRWHRERGFRDIGYHYVVYRDGSVHRGRPNNEVGAHCQGHNTHSLGICYIGGARASPEGGLIAADTRTPGQKVALRTLIENLKQRYPHARILGHHDINPQKACPCFNAALEYAEL